MILIFNDNVKIESSNIINSLVGAQSVDRQFTADKSLLAQIFLSIWKFKNTDQKNYNQAEQLRQLSLET